MPQGRKQRMRRLMNIEDDTRSQIALHMVGALSRILAGSRSAAGVTAGLVDSAELLEILAKAVAMVIEVTPALTTSDMLRVRSEMFGQLVNDHAKEMRDRREATGVGVMETMGAKVDVAVPGTIN